MQPKNLNRLLRALARKGLDVNYDNRTYSVRLNNFPDIPAAEVLLPENFPVEAKALKQLANLANVRHPAGGASAVLVQLLTFIQVMLELPSAQL
jgi:tRNA-splicing ligase RtcB